jgi:hypothetical protein
MHGVVDRQDQRSTALRNTQMPVSVFFGCDCKKAATLGPRKNLRAPVIDPHVAIIDGLPLLDKGQRSTTVDRKESHHKES